MPAKSAGPKRWRYWPLFWFALAVIVACKVINEINFVWIWLKALGRIVEPFFAGFLIAYLLNIPVSALETRLATSNRTAVRKHAKAISIAAVYLGALLILAAIVVLLVPAIAQTASRLSVALQEVLPQIDAFMKEIAETGFLPPQLDFEKGLGTDALKSIVDAIGLDRLTAPLGMLMAVPSALLSTALAVISSIYFLSGKDSYIRFWSRCLDAFVPAKASEAIHRHAAHANTYFKSFFYCQLLDACIVGVLATIICKLAGSEYGLVLGPLIGLLNVIPYFGALVGGVIAVGVTAFTNGWPNAIGIAIALVVLQQVDGNLIQPRILGSQLAMSPLLIIVGITIGGAVWGVLGMVVAIPIAAVLKDILVEAMQNRETRSHKGGADGTEINSET